MEFPAFLRRIRPSCNHTLSSMMIRFMLFKKGILTVVNLCVICPQARAVAEWSRHSVYLSGARAHRSEAVHAQLVSESQND